MFTKVFRILFLFLALSTLLFAQETKEKTLVLQWKFKKGEQFQYQSNMDMKFKVNSPMQNMDGKMNMEFLYHCKVTDVNESAGTATIELKVKSLKMDMDMGTLGRFSIDSTKPETMKKAEKSGQLQAMKIKELLKKTFTLVIDKSGKVQSMTGVEKTQGGKLTLGEQEATLKEIFLKLPMGPIAQGASWTKNLIKVMMGIPTEVETKYLFKEMTKVGNEPCAKISIQQKWKLDFSKNPKAKMLNNITKAKGEGNALFGIESGKMVSKSSKMNLHIMMSGNIGGQDMKIEQKIQGNVNVKLVK